MSDFVGQKFGNYRLIRLLGQGGFAATYLGEQIYLKTEAAVKIVQTQLGQTDQEDFYSEARTIARMKHPNIVRLLEFGVESSRNIPYLIMDYAPHGTLRQRHRRGEQVPISTALSYIKQLAAALQYAHDHKIVHRDVKPENMLVGEGNEILLSDFGIAVVQSTQSQHSQNIAGTMIYVAPEQIQGNPTTASDQYALAVVTYEWLCGTPPFNGSYAEIAIQHERAAPRPLRERVPTIPASIERVVLTALSKDQQRRFPSVQAFAIALEQATTENPSLPFSSPSLPSDPQRSIHTMLQHNTPPNHSGYGMPPASFGAQPSYGLQSPSVPPPPPVAQNPFTPPSRHPDPSTPLPPVSDAFMPRITPQHAQPVQPQSFQAMGVVPTRNPSQSRLSIPMIILLAAALALIVGGSAFAYAGVYLPYQRQLQATTTANAQIVGTTQANASASTTARGQATATQTAMMDIYTQATSGTPLISDQLQSPDNYGWDHTNDSFGKCDFVDGAYHSRAQVGYFYPCFARATNFTDLAFQVEMTIISGTSAGVLFRAPPSASFSGYYLYVNTDGTYNMYKFTDSTDKTRGPTITPLRTGSSSAIHTGVNQMNLLTVVTRGSNIYLYVNKQYVNTVSDDSYKSGQIGIVSNSGDTSGTEALFRNAQIWQL